MKVEKMQDRLMFSQREKLSRIIEDWMDKNKVKNCPASVVSWLSKNGAINYERAIQIIESREKP